MPLDPSRLSLARRIAAKPALDTTTDDLIESKLLLRELLARLDAAEGVVEFARLHFASHPAMCTAGPDDCHDGPCALSPCECPACLTIRTYDASQGEAPGERGKGEG